MHHSLCQVSGRKDSWLTLQYNSVLMCELEYTYYESLPPKCLTPTVFCKTSESYKSLEDLQRYNSTPYLGRMKHATQNTDQLFLLACRAEPYKMGNKRGKRETIRNSSKEGDLVNISVTFRPYWTLGCCEKRMVLAVMKERFLLYSPQEKI